MSQPRVMSALETVANTAVGYVVAIASQIAVFPLFGIHIPFRSNLAIGAWFTVISLVRGYVLRRWFNGLKFATPPSPASPTLPPMENQQ